jgi:Domain of unknown function (DUF4062)
MDKRYQVFVSSTFVDLQEERRQVMQALLELDCIPAGMELFPATDDTQWALIQRVIDDCDYYVVIVGGRYGSMDEEGISYTEREYDYAASKNLPVLGFVHAEPAAIPSGKSERDPKAQEKLESFRAKVQKRMCKFWRTPEELGGVVSRSVVQTMKTHPAEGWVRARHSASPEQLNALRSQIDELEQQLEVSRIAPPSDTEGLAKGGEHFKLHYVYNYSGKHLDTLTLTWDQIFSILGPAMFGELSEEEMRKQLVQKIFGDKKKYEYDGRIIVDQEDFQTIKVQLFALGLIQKSVRKRTASDTKTYWSLTAYGERYATVLKAIRSSG